MADNKVQLIIEALDKTKGAFNSLDKSFQKFQKDLLDINKNLQSAFQATPLVAIAAALKKTANAGEELLKVSQQIGISVENLSGLKYAAEQSEGSVETLTTGVGILSKALAAGADESNDTVETLKMLGINSKETYPALMQLADKFAGMQDSAGKTKLAMELFGRGGKEMIPMLNEGSAGIKKLQEEAAKLGIVFTEDGARAADNFNDAIKKLGDAFWGSIYPAVTSILPQLTQVLENLVPTFKVFGTVVEWTVKIFSYWAADLQKFGAEVYVFGQKIAAVWDWITSGFKGGADGIRKTFRELNADLQAEHAEIEQRWSGVSLGKKPAAKGGKSPAPVLQTKDTDRAAIDAKLKAELEALRTSEAQRLEAYKTEEKNLDLKYAQGLISEKEYIAEKNNLQSAALTWSIAYNELEKKMITSAWEKKKVLFKAEKDRLAEEGNVKAELSKRDQEIAQKQGELIRNNIDLTIEGIGYTKKFAEAEREGKLKILEAEINLKKQRDALAVESGDISALESKKAEIGYEKEALDLRIQNLQAKIADTQADADKATLTTELIALQQQLLEIEGKRKAVNQEISGSFQEGFGEGFRKYLIELRTAFQQGVEIARATASAMQSAFSDFFFDAMAGKLRTLGDYWRSFSQSIMRLISDMLARQAMLSFFNFIPGIAGAAAGAGAAGAAGASTGVAAASWSVNIPTIHEGGYVPRFHPGGLASDEFPAILQRGEYVVSRRGVAAMDAINNGNVSQPQQPPVIVNMNVNTMDAKSFNAYIHENKAAIAGAIMSAGADNHAIRRKR